VFNGNSSSPVFDEFTRRHLGRQQAMYPVQALRRNKYWPPVRRIDGVHGDRNLICSCLPPEAVAEIPREGAHA
jgi:hypothetical protein